MIECPKCGARRKNRCGMSSHIRSHHPEHFAEWRKDSKTVYQPVAGRKDPAAPKRKYTKRSPIPNGAAKAQVRFCPCCGCHLEAIQIALAL